MQWPPCLFAASSFSYSGTFCHKTTESFSITRRCSSQLAATCPVPASPRSNFPDRCRLPGLSGVCFYHYNLGGNTRKCPLPFPTGPLWSTSRTAIINVSSEHIPSWNFVQKQLHFDFHNFIQNFLQAKGNQPIQARAGIFKQSMGARNRVGIGLSYRPARLHRLAKCIPWN